MRRAVGLWGITGIAHTVATDRVPVQAQECCEGGSLLDLITRGSSYSKGKRLYCYCDALRWMTQAAKALEYLHEGNPQVALHAATLLARRWLLLDLFALQTAAVTESLFMGGCDATCLRVLLWWPSCP